MHPEVKKSSRTDFWKAHHRKMKLEESNTKKLKADLLEAHWGGKKFEEEKEKLMNLGVVHMWEVKRDNHLDF